jgi:hypothetical protein
MPLLELTADLGIFYQVDMQVIPGLIQKQSPKAIGNLRIPQQGFNLPYQFSSR